MLRTPTTRTSGAAFARRRALALLLALVSVLAAFAPRVGTHARQARVEDRGLKAASVSALPSKQKRYALVVGVDRYDDAQITPLGGASNDARALADALVRYAGFPAEQVVLLASDQPAERQPTRGQILRRLSNIASVIPKDGLLLFSFAGHGMERGGHAYLLPTDAQVSGDVDLLELTAVNAAQVTGLIQKKGVQQVLLLLDACRDDPTAARSSADNKLTAAYLRDFDFDARNRGVEAFATLYATALGARAYEYKEKRQGYFTWALVEGLKGGAADARGEVTLARLVRFVQERVPRQVALDLGADREQRPFAVVQGFKADDLVLAVARDAASTMATTPAQPSTASGASKAADEHRPSGLASSRLGAMTGKEGSILLLNKPPREQPTDADTRPARENELDPFWVALSGKLIGDGVTTTLMGGEDARGFWRGLESGDKGVLKKLDYSVVIVRVLFAQRLDPFQGMHVARAGGTLTAYDGYTGERLAQEVVADARGFGNTPEQAMQNAWAAAAEKVSDAFVARVLAAARAER